VTLNNTHKDRVIGVSVRWVTVVESTVCCMYATVTFVLLSRLVW